MQGKGTKLQPNFVFQDLKICVFMVFSIYKVSVSCIKLVLPCSCHVTVK